MTLSFREAISFSDLEKLCPGDVFDSQYHVQQGTMKVEVGPLPEVESQAVTIPPIKSEPDGLMLRNKAGDVLDLHTTHISLHLFKPYKGWEQLASDFHKIWKKLQETFPQNEAVEISVRYINELKMPADATGLLNKYIRVTPVWPVEMPGKTGVFFLQMNLFNPDDNLRASFNEAIKKDETAPAGFSVILDITVNCQEQYLLSFENYWPLMESMRNYKNALFEGAITPEMAQTFNQTVQ